MNMRGWVEGRIFNYGKPTIQVSNMHGCSFTNFHMKDGKQHFEGSAPSLNAAEVFLRESCMMRSKRGNGVVIHLDTTL
jgi:hypothetical protein